MADSPSRGVKLEPLVEKEVGQTQDATPPLPPKAQEQSVVEKAALSQSPSLAFSLGSWEAAISAFPMVEENSQSSSTDLAPKPLDYGQPLMGDVEGFDNLLATSPPELEEAPDGATEQVLDRASNCSHGSKAGGKVGSSAGQGKAAATSSGGNGKSAYFSSGIGMSRGGSGRAGGSGDSSRAGSRDEPGRSGPRDRLSRLKLDTASSSEDEGDSDDVPLSTLHLDAATKPQDQPQRSQRRSEKRSVKGKPHGRNPGAGSDWSGEGGVPSDLLSAKLDALLLKAEERKFPWQIAAAAAGQSVDPSRRPTIEMTTKLHASVIGSTSVVSVAPRSSRIEPVRQAPPLATQMREVQSKRPEIVTQNSTAHVARSSTSHLAPSPILTQGPNMAASAHPSSVAGPSRISNSASPLSQTSHHVPTPGAMDVSRSSTSASRGRSRAMSNAVQSPQMSQTSHHRSITEPPAPVRQTLRVPVIIGHLGGPRTMLEVYTNTTAKDILRSAYQRGQLVEASQGLHWVVVEVFGELGSGKLSRESLAS